MFSLILILGELNSILIMKKSDRIIELIPLSDSFIIIQVYNTFANSREAFLYLVGVMDFFEINCFIK